MEKCKSPTTRAECSGLKHSEMSFPISWCCLVDLFDAPLEVAGAGALVVAHHVEVAGVRHDGRRPVVTGARVGDVDAACAERRDQCAARVVTLFDAPAEVAAAGQFRVAHDPNRRRVAHDGDRPIVAAHRGVGGRHAV